MCSENFMRSRVMYSFVEYIWNTVHFGYCCQIIIIKRVFPVFRYNHCRYYYYCRCLFNRFIIYRLRSVIIIFYRVPITWRTHMHTHTHIHARNIIQIILRRVRITSTVERFSCMKIYKSISKRDVGRNDRCHSRRPNSIW